QTCFTKDRRQGEVSKGSAACRFQNKRIPGDQGRTYLPRHNKGRHIPGNYSGTDSKRFLHGKSISALVDRDKISVETARKPAIIFKDICKTFYLVFSFGKRFS